MVNSKIRDFRSSLSVKNCPRSGNGFESETVVQEVTNDFGVGFCHEIEIPFDCEQEGRESLFDCEGEEEELKNFGVTNQPCFSAGRPGCIMCRAEAHKLYARKPIFDALGIQLYAVLHEHIEAEVKDFWPRYWGGVVLLDKSREFFKALGGGSLLKDKCIMCRAEAHKLYARKPIFDALGIQLYAVLHEHIEAEVKDFWPRYWGGVILLDKSREFFKALGGGSLLKDKFVSGFLFNPRAIANYKRAKAMGIDSNFRGEGEIKGGLFIIGKGKSGKKFWRLGTYC
ncbi:hypothetical protein POM88_032868 [Heracleum sosnowskyi]|uniref:Peroxiredoxin-like 2A n=1 Tax=Heracleum sosnowskyi TaxID=360622 RepID=A0AAD8I324_9APIA|nr:hypothetical protein POM88_032868 [Heracleum sosnowskyi]